MVWVPTPPFDERTRYEFKMEGRTIRGVPSLPIPPIKDWDNRRDKTGFETDDILESFVSNGEDIPALIAATMNEHHYLGLPAFDAFNLDRSLLPLRLRTHERLGLCGRPLILTEEKGRHPEKPYDDDGYPVYVRTSNRWVKSFQPQRSPLWRKTAILHIPL
ncbi:MAG TPA: hypothetical protein VD967_00135 [Candidatus Paceibacterota bacterium]|nr:hypothetical protein [Candidatus Paceibacterota bacterium]